MDPFELLKSDHEKVAKLFERIESASGKAKTSIFKQIQNELEIHTQIEEDIFYPALRNAEETRDVTLEAYEEHRVVKDLLAELAGGKPSDQWDAKLTVLKENVEHHVDEEEDDMFGKAKDVLSTEEAEALGDRMAAEKKKLGAHVPDDYAKPGVIKRAINALFGSDSEKADKKKGGKKKAVAKSARTTASKPASPKKSAGKKKTVTKPPAKKAGKKTVKKSSSTSRRAKKPASKKR
jgi:hemerythrin superfamily protein